MQDIKLFVYGTLKKDSLIKTLLGKNFKKKRGILKGYKKYAPKTGFPYILPQEEGEVKGYVLCGLDIDDIEKIDEYEYEGSFYLRRLVDITLHNGEVVKAFTYVGNIEYLRRVFGDKIITPTQNRVYEYLYNKIGDRLNKILSENIGIDLKDKYKNELFLEIFAPEIHHLTNLYYSEQNLSNYLIKSEIEIMGIPSLKELRKREDVKPYMKNYLRFAVKHTIINTLERYIRETHNHFLYNPQPYWQFTGTILAALKLYDKHKEEIEYVIDTKFELENYMEKDYVHYIVDSIYLAELLYKNYYEEIKFIAMDIFYQKEKGYLPLGVELEFSNLGEDAVNFENSEKDKIFCNMKYFYDFDLMRRTWKFGGHIDDHTFRFFSQKKDGGFLEYAFGKNCFFQTYSEPITSDPRILHELVIQTISFSDIKPHSLHLNIQCPYEVDWNKENDPDLLICLLLLGGDFVFYNEKIYREKRITKREIVDTRGKMHFILQNRHHPYGYEEKNSIPVIEFQFPRLSKNKNYELLTMALKGFLIGYQPRPFYERATVTEGKSTDVETKYLMKWACNAKSISNKSISRFIEYVEKGLYREKKGQPAHRKKYISKIIYQIEKELSLRNMLLSNPPLEYQFSNNIKSIYKLK